MSAVEESIAHAGVNILEHEIGAPAAAAVVSLPSLANCHFGHGGMSSAKSNSSSLLLSPRVHSACTRWGDQREEDQPCTSSYVHQT